MPKTYNFLVYIVTNWKKTVLYTGITNNLPQRLREHYENRGKPGTFAGRYFCYNLVYYEWHQYVYNAIDAEKRIKDLKRSDKIVLINGFNAGWHFLNVDVCGEWPPKYEGRLGEEDAT
ncbi:MAG: GIY-YIG nuclease family protein [Saprospiraceae bacterium]|nr:GIY-YIG nuclease family protein [Saprospiraceae bacterium]MCF8248362.1 GIY-YIG nuclease family protein [Saprospiraceae bacterium]MCF8283228.1 GIY-YIG nuclease family protein [Bacteroidales bacterium]MCF8309890.1 GIY-YIG nuclease family protein [Saprospiraceae bacterium]MCF8438779.1 GIY-YIG nuclease family protein [Saprospiraceae bacterium]